MTLLEQRKIEAGVLVPMIQAFQRQFGVEETNTVVADVIAGLARQRGNEIASLSDEPPTNKVMDCFDKFSEGSALELNIIQSTPDAFDVDVTSCKFAELYQELGVPELGYLLSCNRDFAFSEGLSDELVLERSQTIMEGASHCDFRFRSKSDVSTS